MPARKHTATRPATAGHLLAGLWAIDPRTSVPDIFSQLDNAPAMLVEQSDDHRAAYLRALRETGGFTTYFNPDGTDVSSLEQDAKDRILPGAIAVVPIHGVMVRSCPDWWQYYGITSTARATRDVADAIANEKVARIIMSVYSPGGMVYGTEQLSETIRKSTKNIDAHVSDLAASAAVFSIVHCKSINIASKSTEMGSVGTMGTVINDDEFWNSMGVKWIEVYASASTEKNATYNEAADGNPTKMVAYLDAHNANFLNAVKTGRKGATAEVLTGAMFVGQAAIDAGLADGYATLEETIALAAQQVAADDRVPAPDPVQTHTNVMSATAKLAAFAAAIMGIFAKKEEPSADEITNANEALKAEGLTGVQLVTAEQAKGITNLEQLQKDLAAAQQSVTDLTTARDAAVTATAAEKTLREAAEAKVSTHETAVAAFATVHKLEAAEGKSLTETVLEAATKWGALPGAQHAGKGKTDDQKPKEYNSVKAAGQEAGIKS